MWENDNQTAKPCNLKMIHTKVDGAQHSKVDGAEYSSTATTGTLN